VCNFDQKHARRTWQTCAQRSTGLAFLAWPTCNVRRIKSTGLAFLIDVQRPKNKIDRACALDVRIIKLRARHSIAELHLPRETKSNRFLTLLICNNQPAHESQPRLVNLSRCWPWTPVALWCRCQEGWTYRLTRCRLVAAVSTQVFYNLWTELNDLLFRLSTPPKILQQRYSRWHHGDTLILWHKRYLWIALIGSNN
jgi:ABC-type transporter Mla MlaB component